MANFSQNLAGSVLAGKALFMRETSVDNGWGGRGGLICECNVLKTEQTLPVSGKVCSIVHRKNILTDDCVIIPMEIAEVASSERIT